MKTIRFTAIFAFGILIALSGKIPGAAADPSGAAEEASNSPMQGLVKTEVLKTQVDLSREVGEAKVRIQSYDSQKADAIARAKEQSKQDEQGIKLLKEYDRLLSTRYVNKKGDFEPGLELAAGDFEALNNLARTHLYAVFFTGRTSAGFARKAVHNGIKQLDDIYDAHSSPSDGNNPELQIIAKLVKDDEVRIKRAVSLLDQIGLKPDAQVLAQIENAYAQQVQEAADAAQVDQPKKSKRHPAAAKKGQGA